MAIAFFLFIFAEPLQVQSIDLSRLTERIDQIQITETGDLVLLNAVRGKVYLVHDDKLDQTFSISELFGSEKAEKGQKPKHIIMALGQESVFLCWSGDKKIHHLDFKGHKKETLKADHPIWDLEVEGDRLFAFNPHFFNRSHSLCSVFEIPSYEKTSIKVKPRDIFKPFPKTLDGMDKKMYFSMSLQGGKDVFGDDIYFIPATSNTLFRVSDQKVVDEWNLPFEPKNTFPTVNKRAKARAAFNSPSSTVMTIQRKHKLISYVNKVETDGSFVFGLYKSNHEKGQTDSTLFCFDIPSERVVWQQQFESSTLQLVAVQFGAVWIFEPLTRVLQKIPFVRQANE